MLLGCIAILGCDVDVPSAQDELEPLRVLRVWVTTTDATSGALVRTAIEPGGRVDGVTVTTSLAVDLSRFVLPESSTRQAICLRASTDAVEELSDCAEPAQPFLVPDYRPTRRRVTFYQEEGARLAPQTFYRLTIYPPTEDSEYGFRAFDGAPATESVRFDFVTAGQSPTPVEERPPTPARYCEIVDCGRRCRQANEGVGAIEACLTEQCGCLDEECFADGDLASAEGGLFITSCSGAGCHGTGTQSSGAWGTGDVAMGLDLSTPQAIEATALAKVAHQTQVGEHGSSAELSPDRFGRAMPIISPSAPAQSYLVYKALSQLLNHSAANQLDVEFLGELARLRSTVVIGSGMPPSSSLATVPFDPYGRMAWRRLQLLEAWVAHGAVTTCP